MNRFGRWQVRSVVNEDGSVFVCANDAQEEAVVKIPRRESLSFGRRDEEQNRSVLSYEARQLAQWRGIKGVVELIHWEPQARTPYLVMELLGPSLEDSIPETGLDAQACFELIHDLATTLEAIHRRGSSHLDVKPDNILRNKAEGWSLIDPSPPEMATEDYGPSRVLGPPRDLIALSRVFITAYTGSMETELPHEVIDSVLDLSEGERWLKLLRRLSQGAASATDARRAASAILRTL